MACGSMKIILSSRGVKIFLKSRPSTKLAPYQVWLGPASSPAFIFEPGIKSGGISF